MRNWVAAALLVSALAGGCGAPETDGMAVAETRTVYFSTVRVRLEEESLERLQRLSPRLTLMADDGTQALATVWRVQNGQVVITGTVNLRPAHYTLLLAEYPDSTPDRFKIDVNLSKITGP